MTMKTGLFLDAVSLVAGMVLAAGNAIAMQTDVAASGGFVLEFATDNALVIKDTTRGERLFSIQGSRLLLPDFAKDAALVSRNAGDDGALRIEFAGGALEKGVVAAVPHRRGFLVHGEFTPREDVVVNRLEILPAGTTTLFYEINNYRNMQATDQVWTRTILGAAAFSTDTYSKDWQFAPHPSAMLFTRNDAHLLVGTTSAPVGGYGLYASGGKWKLDGFYLHYGEGEWGWKIRSGETWKTPEFYFAFDRGGDVHKSWKSFSDDLVSDGRIADPSKRKVVPWHREHYYCTWGDQTLLSGYIPDADLKKQSLANPSIRGKSWLVLNEKLVMDAADRIRRERLPIRTILIDGGWMRNTMDFRADPVRFPDFRGMVDRLHAMGFKVMVWWTWSECRDENCEKAIGRHNTMLDGKRNCHRRWMADFSKKSAQEEWLKPTMRRLFSSEPGCYDLDGVKTDYQADKIHFDLPAEDPQWRGEENYFRRLYALFTSEMLKYKPDAQHCGCAGNWFLAEYMDLNRTYDVAGDNPREHENRARMLMATAPGVLPVYDMQHFGCRTTFSEWLASARGLGVPVHVGNLFEMNDDEFSGPSPMTPDDFETLRKGLAQ